MLKNKTPPKAPDSRTVVMVVAYPGDETLFAGGQVLMTPNWRWHIVSVFAGSKPESRVRFAEALKRLDASGEILGLSEKTGKQRTLQMEVSAAIVRILGTQQPDMLITHSPLGECRKLLGRDILGRIVTQLWCKDETTVSKLWIFAYEDDNVEAIPMAADEADRSLCLQKDIWNEKSSILLNAYHFTSDAFVIRCCPAEEAFFCFNEPDAFRAWKEAH